MVLYSWSIAVGVLLSELPRDSAPVNLSKVKLPIGSGRVVLYICKLASICLGPSD